MKKYKLSILIPANKEEWLACTVEDILKNKNEETEIIVGLDSAWANPAILDHPDVTIFYSPITLGQRAMQNQLCRLSSAKFVMKLDAHCKVDKDFDRKMLDAFEISGDNVVMVPVMLNLHVFDFKCGKCGNRTYQGPMPTECPKCDNKTNFHKKLVWHAKESPRSVSFCFDKTSHFQYFKEYAKRPEYKKDLGETGLTETFSLQGSCFMLSRKMYWEKDICNDSFGSWGGQGYGVAAAAWLSGGRVLVNHKTWYSHMFRTKKDFSFPYNQSGRAVQKCKKKVKDLFFNNQHPHQTRPLSWLLERFAPINGWSEADIAEQKEREKNHPKFGINVKQQNSKELIKNILFYTCNTLNLKIAHACQKQLRSVSKELDIPIISVSLKPMTNMGHNIHLSLERGILTYYKQILAGLEASTTDLIYMSEHDCLYHKSNFTHIPSRKDVFCYNVNWWKIREGRQNAVKWGAAQVSGLCGYRKHLLEYYRNKIKDIENGDTGKNYEPGGRDKNLFETYESEYAYIDIRHKNTLTGDKWSIDDFKDKSTCLDWQECDKKNIKGWENLKI